MGRLDQGRGRFGSDACAACAWAPAERPTPTHLDAHSRDVSTSRLRPPIAYVRRPTAHLVLKGQSFSFVSVKLPSVTLPSAVGLPPAVELVLKDACRFLDLGM